jgi:hypothetical protein
LSGDEDRSSLIPSVVQKRKPSLVTVESRWEKLPRSERQNFFAVPERAPLPRCEKIGHQVIAPKNMRIATYEYASTP